MPKQKAPRQLGRSIHLPGWWRTEFEQVTKGMSAREIAERMNAATPGAEYTQWNLYPFMDYSTTTIEMTMAIVQAFPALPPPMVFARDLEQAKAFWALSRHNMPPMASKKSDGSKISETIDDTGEVSVEDSAAEPVAEPAQKPRQKR